MEDEFEGLEPCPECGGSGDRPRESSRQAKRFCKACQGVGYPEVPTGPTDALPGSPRKIAILAARWAKRLPLFEPDDGLEGDDHEIDHQRWADESPAHRDELEVSTADRLHPDGQRTEEK